MARSPLATAMRLKLSTMAKAACRSDVTMGRRYFVSHLIHGKRSSAIGDPRGVTTLAGF